GFTLLRWTVYGGLAAAAISLIGLVSTFLGRGKRGAVLAVLGLVVGLSVAAVPWQWRRIARSVPPIHDITTDTENPPQFVTILPLRADAPNPPEYAGAEVAAQQRVAYPELGPLILPIRPERAFEQALEAARGMRWEIVDANAAEGRIEATDQTFWFGFLDDVVIRVTPTPEGSRIDVRSKSRVGGSDVGTNARRIRRYFDRVQREG
ncbi:MAG TPA: DUF1499 domain-containing protein, partial [Longimicrobiaceae bacterium]|nr:DUF1499 domain-containing protein [Longimicrobiaceae bacterium]